MIQVKTMVSHNFLSIYQLSNGIVVGSATGIVAKSDEPNLAPGDQVTMERSGSSFIFEFKYASGDGFVATLITGTFPTGDYWFSDTPRPNGTAVPNDGTSYVLCFLEGTHIATPAGEVPVESLRIGQLVRCVDGTARPVRWLGRRTVAARFADPRASFPILIRAGALGEALPARDLYLSPSHALGVDGVLAEAAALVNRTTIRQVVAASLSSHFTYVHIELEDHALILAEGVAAETFVDNVTRSRFDNYAEYVALYGEAPGPTGEMDAPRVKSPRQLPASIRARLAARAATLLPAAKAA